MEVALETLLNRTLEKEPFSLVRINDGESLGIIRPGTMIARDTQIAYHNLSMKLKEALAHEQDNYWVGIPCPYCQTNWYNAIDNYYDPEYENLTYAVVTTNRNWKKFTTKLPEIINNTNRSYIWVSGEDQDISKLSKFGFKNPPRLHVVTPTTNAWFKYDKIKEAVHDFTSNDVIILSCGPTSRVLAKEWFEQNNQLTIWDVGSAFDCYTRNFWLDCHRGTVKSCKGCM